MHAGECVIRVTSRLPEIHENAKLFRPPGRLYEFDSFDTKNNIDLPKKLARPEKKTVMTPLFETYYLLDSPEYIYIL